MKDVVNSVHSALQKGLHVAEGIVGGIATAKGLYDAGRTIYIVGKEKCSSLRVKHIRLGAM